MENKTIQILGILTIMLLGSCATVTQTEGSKRPRLSISAGVNKGGITENTDMSVVTDAIAPAEATVDAFTGATGTGYNMGVHVTHDLKRLQFESGLDYMYNTQSFNYIDQGVFALGQRDLDVHQLMAPVTLNIPVLGRIMPVTDLRLKIGFLGQYNMITVMDMGVLPDYTINNFSGGLMLGVSLYPFHFANSSKLGFYLEGYRGSQVYEDRYNLPEFEMPGSSFVRAGITYKFR